MAVFTEVEKNVFIVNFSTDADKQRVLDEKPWLFENNLFVLQALNGPRQLIKIKFNLVTFGSSYIIFLLDI